MTTTQALQWVTDPKTLKQISTFDAWDCKKTTTQTVKPCTVGNKCALSLKLTNVTDTRYMETCADCPNKYPWLGDSEGTGIPGRDSYAYNGKEPSEPGTSEEVEVQQK